MVEWDPRTMTGWKAESTIENLGERDRECNMKNDHALRNNRDTDDTAAGLILDRALPSNLP